MKLAIDLDWTLADFSHMYRKLLGMSRRLTTGELKAIIAAKNDVIANVVYGVWTQFYGYCGMYPLLTDGSWPRVVRRLKNMFEEICLVSLREVDERANIEAWLGALEMKNCFDRIVLLGVDGDKTDVDADILVDDSLDNCFDYVLAGRKAILWGKNILKRGLVIRDADTVIEVAYGAKDVERLLADGGRQTW